jgi:hypothetical protein
MSPVRFTAMLISAPVNDYQLEGDSWILNESKIACRCIVRLASLKAISVPAACPADFFGKTNSRKTEKANRR